MYLLSDLFRFKIGCDDSMTIQRSSIFILSDMSKDIDAYSVLFVIH